MKKVIIFGDLPIATKVAKFISEYDYIELSAIVIGNENPNNNDPWEDELLIDYANGNQIDIKTLAEIASSQEEYDLGISCRFSRIIKNDVLSKFTLGIVNFHGGLLPEYGGLYSVVHTILSGSDIGGGTIHWINEGIDTGNVIKRCEVKVLDTDDAYDLFVKTQKALLYGFKEVFDEVIAGTSKSMSIEQLVSLGYAQCYFDKNSLAGKRYIEFDELNTEKSLNIIRAFSFLDYPSAYTEIFGTPVSLRYEKNDAD
ncbi:formyltransferase family protein [Vibrio owensii]|uniref:formyltransferase family protein n=1 Tax=Vibrio owensii TaxID=696485 RepID=UPI00215BE06E|nr:formyltransferase family protein [Vibrio owensii]MCR9940807.1 hypothetical protein [Vibrio owensii]